MRKSSGSKGQFFIISSVIIVSLITLVAQYLSDYRKVDLTSAQETDELEYISQIKNTLVSAAANSRPETREEELTYTENFLKEQLGKKGISLGVQHKIYADKIFFSFSMTTPRFSSSTEFYYP